MSELRPFRTRDEQVNEIHEATAKRVCARRSDYPETVYHAYINAQIQEAEARGAAAERERIIKAIKSERLEDTVTDPTDLSYNMAIEHCLESIEGAKT